MSIIFLMLCSCRSQFASEYMLHKKKQIQKWTPLLGEKITLTGEAVNYKIGAGLLIKKDSINIWINGLRSWPENYYLGEGKSKTLEVSGVLIEKYDLPVFRRSKDPKSGITRTGIPIPYGINLKKASHRFLLKDANWVIID
ncbi:hypothetical protein [Dokdonia pacifica]|uniref:hypothetical protein n=1 Tax=Dokdonia pacifica TaxID=1627892 RepID=UPI00117867C3|nr:hypothetical protein [Dokdonia pacifica]